MHAMLPRLNRHQFPALGHHRFGRALISRGQFEDYMDLLKSAHRDANVDDMMCRDLIDWRGYAGHGCGCTAGQGSSCGVALA